MKRLKRQGNCTLKSSTKQMGSMLFMCLVCTRQSHTPVLEFFLGRANCKLNCKQLRKSRKPAKPQLIASKMREQSQAC